jgi:methylmalonyl-CoA/ethylmalonyl-CoA epimerase
MFEKDESLEALGLPPIDQVGFVVRDLDEALARYAPLFGPFTRMDGSVSGADYRGQEEDVQLDIGFGHSGELEIEFIEWKAGRSPHREFIEQGREGLHHLRSRVESADAWVEKLSDVGYLPIWYKAFSPEITFAYLERKGDPLLLEILQMP